MEIFKLLSIPHSEPVLKLLEFLLFVSFSIYFIYWSFYLGTFFSAFYYALKFISSSNKNYLEISQKYLHFLNKGLVAPFGLAIFPFFAFVMILVQFQPNKLPSSFETLIFVNFLSLLCSLVSSRVYKKLFKESGRVTKFNILLLGIANQLFILITIWLSIGIYFQFISSSTIDSFIYSLFSFYSLARLILFIFAGLVLSSFAYLFFIIPVVDESQLDFDNRNLIHKNVGRGLTFGIFIPLFLFLNFISAPTNNISFFYYLLSLTSILVVFFSLMLSYTSFNRINVRIVRISFYMLILSLAFFVGSETSLFAIASKKQKFIINLAFQKYHEQLLASAGRSFNIVNGEEIYNAKCVACHNFDTKLVGPPHREVLAKYKDKPEEMVKFILNPVKVNPDYPPMPAPGLKPNEAEAVVKYMFEHYGPMLK